MRLQKFLSDVGFCSRREAEGYIKAGKILIDGKKATLGDKVTGKENIIIDGQKLQVKEPPRKKLIVFYKPKGVECTMTQTVWMKTLMDFDFGADRVFPIGRQDKDSHGLLLLTNDGQLGNKLAQPSAEHEEEYVLTVKEKFTPERVEKFKQGILLEKKNIIPHNVQQVEDKSLRCTLYEGRDKHIRKLCEAAGLEILDLQRIRVGTIELGELEAGKWRELTETEFQTLKNGGVVPRSRRRIVPVRRK